MSRRKGQIILFFILAVGVGLFITLMVMKAIHVQSVLDVKKTVSLSMDMSDKGTAVLSLLKRESQGKSYMRVLGESVADNHASQPQDAYNSLKATLSNLGSTFSFHFQENPDVNINAPERPAEHGECGHTQPDLKITLEWPSDTGRITSPFGYRDFPRPCYCHSGLDISSEGDESDSVMAAYDGTVVFLYDNCKASPNCFKEPDNKNCNCPDIMGLRGFGNMITLEHTSPDGEKFYTHYFHLRDIEVENGQEVEAGQKIAMTGNTGRSEAIHLHFELSTSKTPRDIDAVNPCLYFKEQPSNCEAVEIASCSVSAGANIFNVDIPLPGAVTGKLKGKVVMEK